MKKIMIFHASAGAGHRKVAEVLAKKIGELKPEGVSCVMEDSLDSVPAFFKKSYVDTYFYAVKHIPGIWGWSYEVLDRPGIYAMARPFRSAANRFYGRRLLDRVVRESPDVLVCTHFLTAELFAAAKKKGLLRSTIVTVVTDFLPHTFWVNDGTDVYWVMGTDAAENLIRRGVDPRRIQAKGIPVDEAFKPLGKKAEMRKKYGLDDKRLTLLLTSGSFGLGPNEAILRELEAFKNQIQCLVVCGNNAGMKETLERGRYGFPVKIFGFVNFMPELMEAADLMIAKSGGATTSESLAKGLPMVVLEPIPGQETRNADVMKAHGAAFFMILPEQIKPIVQAVLENPKILEDKRRSIARLAKPDATRDLAAFILSGHGAACPSSGTPAENS